MSTIHTPPSSTLSLPSDTEIDGNTMPPSRPIYLVVATALKPSMGIGLDGSLPWPALKKDMTFFRRVTSNAPPGSGRRNAVIMGRKTWESIPKKFRPLKGRVNVVVTRNVGAFAEGDGREVFAVSGLREGLDVLEDAEKVFVIGGSQIYREAMEQRVEGWGPLRVLQTQVRRTDGEEIDCDTFFPVRLDEGETVEGWKQASMKEVEAWVDGETVPGSDDWEVDGESKMEIRVFGWERSP